jgi:glycosyltransferase involved in cell wall biosynthesis
VKIAVVNNFFPPRVGGSAHLAEALAHQYAQQGHEVLVLTAAFGDGPRQENTRGYRVERLPAVALPKLGLSIDFDITFVSRPGARRRVRRLLDEFQPDVIHQHGQFLDLSWYSGRWAQQHGVPVLLSVHTRLENPNRTYSLAFTALDYLVVRPIVNSYTPYFVVMDRIMDGYIRSRYSARENQLVDIPVAVEVGRFARGDGARVRRELGLGDRPVILSLGHVIPLRNRVLLAEALPGVLRQHPDAMVVVVGNVHDDSFLQVADGLGIADHFLCVGAVPKSEIPDYLDAAQVECHDLQGYGLGTASLESMAAEVPVVAAVRADNFRGIGLENGTNLVTVSEGRPAELAGALSAVLSQPTRYARVAARQRELVERHFSIEAVAAKHLEALDAMLQRSRPLVVPLVQETARDEVVPADGTEVRLPANRF